jgi:hypothetical protein
VVDFKCSYFVHATFQRTPIVSLYIMSLHKKIIFKDVGKFLWLNESGYILRKQNIECDR